MSRNGSGTYSLPAGNPVVTGTTITTTWANTTLNDIASSLTGSVAADGQTPMSGALNMANNKVTALATPTASTDAVTKAYADTLIAGNGTMAVQNANAVAITGGAIDGTTIGTSTKADGKFTTLSANGDVSFTSTGFLLVPSGTTAQRPASPATGEMRYNTTLNQFEGYYASAWSGLGSGASGSNTQVQYNNAGALAGSSALTFNGTTLATTTLQSTNLSDGTNSTSTTNAIQGSAKAWANINTSGASGSIRASYNVSSVTYNATGDYTVNFTNAFSDANYVTNLTMQRGDSAGNNPGFANIYATSGNAYTSITTTSVRITTSNASAGAINVPYVGVACFR